VEISTWIDDYTRFVVHCTPHPRVTGPIVLASFRNALAQHGIPASTLTDEGMVFTTRFSNGKGGRNGLEHEPRRLHVVQKNFRGYHPEARCRHLTSPGPSASRATRCTGYRGGRGHRAALTATRDPASR
jgi:hypothetical protein